MTAVVSLQEVVDALSMLFDGQYTFLNRNTGELVTLSDEEMAAAEEEDDLEEYPEW